MAMLLTGIGLVLVLEGLIFALLPGRLDSLLAAMASLSRDQRRLIGLGSMVFGLLFLWIARA